MNYISIYEKRIKHFLKIVMDGRYGARHEMQLSYTVDSQPIPYADIAARAFKPIHRYERWGEAGHNAWFRIEAQVPAAFAGKQVVALINLGSEAAVWKDGYPWHGLAQLYRWDGNNIKKRRVPLFVDSPARGKEQIELLVEAVAMDMFGYANREKPGENRFQVWQAELAVFRQDWWQLALDIKTLLLLWEGMPKTSPRAQRILYVLNKAANCWNDGKGVSSCKELTAELLQVPANASALTAWSVGHGHLDLAWLWTIPETRRKGGRTFANALQLIKEYPSYVFGASQAQLYEWIKEDYPSLYQGVQQAYKQGRWEVQGAAWVEPDTNIPSGESLIRQCMYGKRFFYEEFGADIKTLWLPDTFGYSAALPQILQGCDVDVLMTQKISWNETNTFSPPYILLDWHRWNCYSCAFSPYPTITTLTTIPNAL